MIKVNTRYIEVQASNGYHCLSLNRAQLVKLLADCQNMLYDLDIQDGAAGNHDEREIDLQAGPNASPLCCLICGKPVSAATGYADYQECILCLECDARAAVDIHAGPGKAG